MADANDGEVTRLLAALGSGEKRAAEDLYAAVYERLRAMAHRRMVGERAGHTLDATALVHEAFMKLAGQDRVDWKNRAHFYSVAAMAMRRILINHAEARRASKRGGGEALATFNEEHMPGDMKAEEILDLDEALQKLAKMSERQSKVVEYRFFAGMSHEEIAEVLEVSVGTVRRDWRVARAWLNRAMSQDA